MAERTIDMCNRSKHMRTLSLLVMLFVSRAADAGVTYHYSPDLALEGNPLVSVLGMGVTPFFAINIVLTLLVSALAVFDGRYRPRYPVERGLSFSEFTTMYGFGEKTPLWRVIWRTPKDLKTFLQGCGYVLPRVAIPTSFYCAAIWYLIHHVEGIRRFHNWMYPFGYLVLLGLLGMFTIGCYCRREFGNYQRAGMAM